jgi:hypothetical protein
LAYRRRKETVEQQIKEHNQAKQMAHKKPQQNVYNNINKNDENQASSEPNKCPFKSSENNLDSCAIKSSTNEANSETPLNQMKPNKKVVVSIQTNEEKAKENILSKKYSLNHMISLISYELRKFLFRT